MAVVAVSTAAARLSMEVGTVMVVAVSMEVGAVMVLAMSMVVMVHRHVVFLLPLSIVAMRSPPTPLLPSALAALCGSAATPA